MLFNNDLIKRRIDCLQAGTGLSSND